MKTDFSAQLLATSSGSRANEILRSCVHCGFCNATCPTYQQTGDELDGPRGRIYLIRELLQSGANEQRARFHLDRCLTCRACETTCPSGVQYGELAEIARNRLGPQRPGWQGLLRRGLQWMIPNARRLRLLAGLGRLFRWAMPSYLAAQVPAAIGRAAAAQPGERPVLLLNGCAQQVSTAATNEHLAALLAARGVGVEVAAGEGCCGALDLHLGDEAAALDRIRANVDVLYARLQDVEAIVSTASGCGVTVKDYGRLLAEDAGYADKAARVAARTLDVSEYLAAQDMVWQPARPPGSRVAWHPPCSLQHGQQISGLVEALLQQAGYELTGVADAHLCCGSAGTYSILQADMSENLRAEKLRNLLAGQPDFIVTGNVGCQVHLAGPEAEREAAEVLHWVQLIQ